MSSVPTETRQRTRDITDPEMALPKKIQEYNNMRKASSADVKFN